MQKKSKEPKYDISNIKPTDILLVGKKTNRLATTSRIIADVFEKNHKNVLKKIRDLKENIDTINGLQDKPVEQTIFSFEDHFHERKYLDEKGEKRSEYIMDQEGFTLLMSSFADGGEKNRPVLEWKIKFNQAFWEMKEQLEHIREIAENTVISASPLKMLEEITADRMADKDRQITELRQMNSYLRAANNQHFNKLNRLYYVLVKKIEDIEKKVGNEK